MRKSAAIPGYRGALSCGGSQPRVRIRTPGPPSPAQAPPQGGRDGIIGIAFVRSMTSQVGKLQFRHFSPSHPAPPKGPPQTTEKRNYRTNVRIRRLRRGMHARRHIADNPLIAEPPLCERHSSMYRKTVPYRIQSGRFPDFRLPGKEQTKRRLFSPFYLRCADAEEFAMRKTRHRTERRHPGPCNVSGLSPDRTAP